MAPDIQNRLIDDHDNLLFMLNIQFGFAFTHNSPRTNKQWKSIHGDAFKLVSNLWFSLISVYSFISFIFRCLLLKFKRLVEILLLRFCCKVLHHFNTYLFNIILNIWFNIFAWFLDFTSYFLFFQFHNFNRWIFRPFSNVQLLLLIFNSSVWGHEQSSLSKDSYSLCLLEFRWCSPR